MHVIKANTANECKIEIVKWLRHQATVYSSNGRIARKKTVAKEWQQGEIALTATANFLEHSIKVIPND